MHNHASSPTIFQSQRNHLLTTVIRQSAKIPFLLETLKGRISRSGVGVSEGEDRKPDPCHCSSRWWQFPSRFAPATLGQFLPRRHL